MSEKEDKKIKIKKEYSVFTFEEIWSAIKIPEKKLISNCVKQKF